ncbi:MAG: D-aminoacyl-tRNA deacylase [Candidatus Ratteibacteria bacterium]|jgi:D-tyrosyl-tRNA(Tyr) deacylase
MKAIIQRVESARLFVEEKETGRIEHGLVALIGFGAKDTANLLERMVSKIINLRIFSDSTGKMGRSVADINAGIMLISQFTLYGKVVRGNRPDFTEALAPLPAKQLYEEIIALFKRTYTGPLVCGTFGSEMKVELCNDGPVTILIEMD